MRIAALLLVSTASLPAFADDGAWHVAPSAAVGIEHLDYAEYAPTMIAGQHGGVVDTNRGFTPTARVDVDVTSPSARLFARGSASWTSGATRYDGGVQDLMTGMITPISGPTAGYMLDFDLVAGVRGWVAHGVMVGAFAGFGHHSWERDGRGVDPVNMTGYLEDYAWFYLQAGLRVDVAPIDRLHVALEASGLVPHFGSLAITHQPNGFDDVNLDLQLGTGKRARLLVAYAITPRIAVFALAGVETDTITSSSAAPLTMNGQPVTAGGQPLYVLEPYSETTRLVATAGAGYTF